MTALDRFFPRDAALAAAIDQSFSEMALGLSPSKILVIAYAVKAAIESGAPVANFTVGDFAPELLAGGGVVHVSKSGVCTRYPIRVSVRCNCAHSSGCAVRQEVPAAVGRRDQVPSAWRRTITEFDPPKAKELLMQARSGRSTPASRTWATPAQAGSSSARWAVGGVALRRRAWTQTRASVAPVAPIRWPCIDLVALTARPGACSP